MRLRIFVDGGSRGNPGPAAAGVVIQDAGDSAPMHEAGYFLGRATNNVAEYTGMIKGLEIARGMGGKDLDIYSDSELMVRQIKGEYKVKSPDLRPLYERVVRLLEGVGKWRVSHVRREMNSRADELANKAMDAGRDVIEEEMPVVGVGGTKAGGKARVDEKKEDSAPPLPSPLFWTAEISGAGGKTCPLGCRTGKAYEFGAMTPGGLCVHAARAVLDDGPVQWGGAKRSGAVACGHCGVRIEMKVKG